MDIESLTIGEARRLAAIFTGQQTDSGAPYTVGQAYLFRTVTYAVSGVFQRATPYEIVVTDAAWVADTGRFAEALANAEFSEVEAAANGEVIIGRGAVVDAWPIAKAPRITK